MVRAVVIIVDLAELLIAAGVARVAMNTFKDAKRK